MDRLTREENGMPFLEKGQLSEGPLGYTGRAVERLAAFETVYQRLVLRQQELAEELEALRQEGKKNSVKFKELLGEKLMNANAISQFKTYVED